MHCAPLVYLRMLGFFLVLEDNSSFNEGILLEYVIILIFLSVALISFSIKWKSSPVYP